MLIAAGLVGAGLVLSWLYAPETNGLSLIEASSLSGKEAKGK
jgi:hypothetical protein